MDRRDSLKSLVATATGLAANNVEAHEVRETDVVMVIEVPAHCPPELLQRISQQVKRLFQQHEIAIPVMVVTEDIRVSLVRREDLANE